MIVAIAIVTILALSAGAYLAYFLKYGLENLFQGGDIISRLKVRKKYYEAMLRDFEKRGASADSLDSIRGNIEAVDDELERFGKML